MKKTLLLLLMLGCCASPLSALASQLSFKWNTEVSDALPYNANAFQGETFTLDVGLRQYGQDLTGAATATFYYQTKDMPADQWYSATAQWDATTGRATVDFTPAMDCGATAYRFFFGIETTQGKNYRAYGTLRMKPSPGFNPATLEAPDVYAEIVADILEDVFAQSDTRYATKQDLSALDEDLSLVADRSATNAEAIDSLNESKQDTLTAGASIDLSENVISVYGDEPTYQTAGPAAAGDRGEGMGYQGTINTILAGNEGSIALREISIMRRTNNATWWQKTLYCRVLRQVNNTWVTALQSANAVRMDSAAVDAWLGPWQMEPTAPEHASFPAGEVVRIVWVEDPTVAANTNTLIGCRTTGTYAGFIGSDNATTYAFAPCFKLTYRTGFITRGQMNEAIDTAIEAIPEPVSSWNDLQDKPSTFTPSAHTHTTDQITDFSTEVGKVETWVKAHAPDANGNITHTNLNSRANTLSDTAYVNEGGSATRSIAAVTAEGTTKAQVQQILDSTSSAHLSVNTMTSGAQATVKARAIGSSDNLAALAASNSGAKLLLSDATGSLTLTPTTQWPWSKLSGIPTTFTPAEHNHDGVYLKLSGGTVTGNLTLKGSSNYVERLVFGGLASNAGLMTRGISGKYPNEEKKGGLYLNFDNAGATIPSATYLNGGNQTEGGRSVFIQGLDNDAIALRRIDGDTLYAAKTHTHDSLAPISSVTMTESDVTYIWQWDDTAGTFALVPQE